MFRKNDKHGQADIFTNKTFLSNRLKKRLKNHWSVIFYEKIFKFIKEDDFSVIYCNDNGRPNYPVNILVAFEIIKEMKGLTDEDMHEHFHFDISYQQAFGIENINEWEFSIRTLYYFRSRLAEFEFAGNPNPIMNVFKDGRDKIIEELGIKTNQQRIDSVYIGANIKRMNRLMLFHKVLSNLLKFIQNNGIEINEEMKKFLKEDEDSISYRLTSDRVGETIKEIARSLYNIIEYYRDNPDINESKEYKDACRLLSEQCNISDSDNYPNIKLKEPKDISSGSIQNPADTDATYKKKNNTEYRGYKVEAAETCNKDNPVQVVTSVETYKNNVDDTVNFAKMIQDLHEETDADTLIVDGGFPCKEARECAEELEIEIIATGIRGKKTEKEDILNTNDFVFDDQGLIEKCPNSKRPIKQTLNAEKELKASFDRRECTICRLNSRCIAYLSENKSCLKVDVNRRWLDKRASEILNEEYRKKCLLRPPVEGLMEKIKPKYLSGRTLFRSLAKVKSRSIYKAIGINFKRYRDFIDIKINKIFIYAENLGIFPFSRNILTNS